MTINSGSIMTEDNERRSPIYGSLAQGGQFYRRPGARLSEPQDESVINLSSGSGISDARHEGFHAFDKAHAVMLTEQKIIPEEAGQAILRGLRQMEQKGHVAIRRESGHSAHSGEAYLITKHGENVGGWLHLARSSHDLGAVSARLELREQLLDTIDAGLDLLSAYADRAQEHADTIVPTYTGLQHAQVATIGFCLIAFACPIRRDIERLEEAYSRVNVSPAGAAVGTTSDFPIDRERVAHLLGFDDVHNNAEDVDKSYDITLECGSVFATMLADVALAADRFLIWYSKEFDLLDVPDRFAGTSSIMPQKKNPHTIESVQRDTNDMIGEMMQSFAATKNIGGGVGLSGDIVEQAIGNVQTWAELVGTAEFDAERGEKLVYSGWALATDIAGMLVREADIPWRTAHQITAILVRHAEEDRATNEYLGESLEISQEAIDSVVDAQRAVKSRNEVTGSPSPSQVVANAETLHEFVDDQRDTIITRREELKKSERRLEQAIDAIVETTS
jgi:argininosuccinate lyase